MPVFTEAELTQICHQIQHAVGVPEPQAAIVSQTMVESNLAGHDSHGVIQLPQYVLGIQNGTTFPRAEIEIERESKTTTVINGNWGVGPVIATKAMDLAVEKARHADVGCVAVHRCNEVLRLGGYGPIATDQQMMATLYANDHGAGRCVAPFGGIEGRSSTNPIVYAIPTLREPILLDMSTSVVAAGKVRLQGHRQQPTSEGWLINAAGKPTTDVNDFYGPPPGALLPFGGIAAHKGFGLNIVTDILAGALSGAGCSRKGTERSGNGLLITVINISSLIDFGDFCAEVERFVDFVKSSSKADGVSEILSPGERGVRERENREREGIFIEDGTWSQICALGSDLGIDRLP